MPIDYKEYHPKWSLISRLIRFYRAQNRCEFCAVPNHTFITRDKRGFWTNRFTHTTTDEILKEGWTVLQVQKELECTYIVLTVAHLDHDKTNNRFNNLAALCQRCHLKYDTMHRVANRKYGRKHKQNNYKLEF